jgi:hypothetical protein
MSDGGSEWRAIMMRRSVGVRNDTDLPDSGTLQRVLDRNNNVRHGGSEWGVILICRFIGARGDVDLLGPGTFQKVLDRNNFQV